jgi:apolipoprotein N-acyltransferase
MNYISATTTLVSFLSEYCGFWWVDEAHRSLVASGWWMCVRMFFLRGLLLLYPRPWTLGHGQKVTAIVGHLSKDFSKGQGRQMGATKDFLEIK